eukprot:CAMPEP_0177232776 /NCGR_PEP_ID=MMETSP0367-20130122/43508_1 /TAXON_ID=447022 ORGANISM="Scrippsiella hangoei-like, Strain SHHI-4" /NCGR_SAMPLE_ID=MMETSP0367 /ASSEMBLY_ACC=CAM_ASM_000362 /LENGTH=243 /DNA_ID=CAMNT_0018683455 /DNA_START=245 /DNA_END=977 /DNA_ORIENTATION=+
MRHRALRLLWAAAAAAAAASTEVPTHSVRQNEDVVANLLGQVAQGTPHPGQAPAVPRANCCQEGCQKCRDHVHDEQLPPATLRSRFRGTQRSEKPSELREVPDAGEADLFQRLFQLLLTSAVPCQEDVAQAACQIQGRVLRRGIHDCVAMARNVLCNGQGQLRLPNASSSEDFDHIARMWPPPRSCMSTWDPSPVSSGRRARSRSSWPAVSGRQSSSAASSSNSSSSPPSGLGRPASASKRAQ